MSISRGGLVLFCFGTICVSLLLIKAAEAESSEKVDIHAVHREDGCKGGAGGENKGNQCADKDDVLDVDDDFDDTYKVVNKVKVSLSGMGQLLVSDELDGHDTDEDDQGGPEDSDLEHNDRVIVMGH